MKNILTSSKGAWSHVEQKTLVHLVVLTTTYRGESTSEESEGVRGLRGERWKVDIEEWWYLGLAFILNAKSREQCTVKLTGRERAKAVGCVSSFQRW